MIDSTDAAVIELALKPLPGQGHRQLDQPRGRRGALRAGRAAGSGRYGARAWSSAASTRTSSRAWRSRAQRKLAIAERSPRAAHRASTACPSADLIFDPLVFPVRHRRRELRRLGRRDDRGRPRASRQRFPRLQDHPRHLQRLLRPARRRPRGAELRLPLPLHQGRARLRDRQHRAARALRLDPRGGARARRGPDLLARARIRWRPSPPTSADGRKAPPAAKHACRSTSGWPATSSRARRTG